MAGHRPEGELIDEAYLARNFQPLKKEDYPDAPKALFSDPKSFLWDGVTSRAWSSCVVRGGIYQCTVAVRMPDDTRVEALGEAQNKVRLFLIRALHHVAGTPCTD